MVFLENYQSKMETKEVCAEMKKDAFKKS